jgi:hypothetical protein
MDIAGAKELSRRLAQQQHWRQARAVRIGRQPSFDPDGHALERFLPGVRYYRERRQLELRDGEAALVVRRHRKRLVEGVWEDEVSVEAVERSG